MEEIATPSQAVGPGSKTLEPMESAAQRPAAHPNEAENFSIQASKLTKQFGSEVAVREVTFTIPQGIIFGFIGPSGCGKTTTVRLLTGIYEPTAGEVAVLGQSPRTFTPALRRRIGYMPQQFVLYPALSVWENLNFVASCYGIGPWRGRRFKELLGFVELAEHKRKLASQLSGGMQRRLALAATLVHDPDILFLDEPTAGVDPVLRRKFWDYFATLRSSGRTLFIATQYVSEAAYCDVVGVMHAGRLLMIETPDGLRRRALGGEVVDLRTGIPVDYQRQEILSSLPFVRGRVRPLDDRTVRLVVDDARTAIPQLLDWCNIQNLPIESVEKSVPPLDDIFVELMRQEQVHD